MDSAYGTTLHTLGSTAVSLNRRTHCTEGLCHCGKQPGTRSSGDRLWTVVAHSQDLSSALSLHDTLLWLSVFLHWSAQLDLNFLGCWRWSPPFFPKPPWPGVSGYFYRVQLGEGTPLSVISHVSTKFLEARPLGTLPTRVHPFQKVLIRGVNIRNTICLSRNIEVVVIFFLILSLHPKNSGKSDQNVRELGGKPYPFRRFEGTEWVLSRISSDS